MGTPSKKLTFEDAVVVWLKHWDGRFNHEIAADFQCNQGRISEVITLKLHKGSREVAAKIRAGVGKSAPSASEQLTLEISETPPR